MSASRIVLAGGSEFDIDTLDNAKLLATLPQGEIYVHIRALAPNEVYTVQTPRGPGDDRRARPVRDRRRRYLQPDAGDSDRRRGADQRAKSVAGCGGEPDGDDNRHRQFRRQHRPGAARCVPDRHAGARAAAAGAGGRTTAGRGADDRCPRTSANTGTWSQAPDYGQVWYPQVAAGWVPYRDGHWAYVRAVGLDLGGQRAVGLRAVPLRPLGGHQAAAGAGRLAWIPASTHRYMRRRW